MSASDQDWTYAVVHYLTNRKLCGMHCKSLTTLTAACYITLTSREDSSYLITRFLHKKEIATNYNVGMYNVS